MSQTQAVGQSDSAVLVQTRLFERARAKAEAREMAASMLAQRGLAGPGLQRGQQQFDSSSLSDQVVSELHGPQEDGGDVSAIKNMLSSLLTTRLGTSQMVQPAGRAQRSQAGSGPSANGGGGSQGQQAQPQTKVHVEFQPLIQANTIQAPGDAIGKFNIRKEQVPGQKSAPEARGGGDSGSSSESGGGDSRSIDDSQVPPAQEATAGSGAADPRQAQVDEASANSLRQLQGQGQSGGVGSIVSSGGSSVAIPEDGGTLKTSNWEQATYVHPGGELQGRTLLERYRKLDNSPSQVYFEAGKSGSQAATDLEAEQKKHPTSALAAEIQQMRNPSSSGGQ